MVGITGLLLLCHWEVFYLGALEMGACPLWWFGSQAASFIQHHLHAGNSEETQGNVHLA